MSTKEIKIPSLYLYLTEGVRSFKERAQSFRFRRKYQPITKGDGHPVLVIPGFLGNDRSTLALRKFLKRIGYKPYAWELGINLANFEDINTLEKKVNELYLKHQEKISIVGWSLGGIYARELSKRNPSIIQHIITTGSPFRGINQPNRVNWLLRLLRGDVEKEIGADVIQSIAEPTAVLTTSIYSKKDGAVPWQTCMEAKEDDLHKNIEVSSSHIGMPHNKEVLLVIAERLPINSSVSVQKTTSSNQQVKTSLDYK